MTVSVLSVSARGDGEVAVTFEIKDGNNFQRECFVLSAELYADLRVKVGEATREIFDAVAEAAELYRAVKKGLSLLSYGSSSEKALVRKLVQKGFSQEISRLAVEELRQGGYVNELEDAFREAERSVAKLWGRKRIVAHLYEKGFSAEAVKSAIYAIEDSGVDFADVCADRLRQKYTDLPTDVSEKQKLIASLMRYGFSSSDIKQALLFFREK